MTIYYDTKQLDAALKNIDFTPDEFLKIEQKGASVLKDGIKKRAAKDTGQMIESVNTHVVSQTKEQIEDHVGPEVKYAIYQECGTGIFAENGQGRKTPWTYRRADGKFIRTQGNKPHPFIRPTVAEDGEKVTLAIQKEFMRYLLTKWQK